MNRYELKLELESRYRDELNIIARRLGVSAYRRLKKAELIAAIMLMEHSVVERALSVSWWDRYHNHVYGAATIVGILMAIVIWAQDGTRGRLLKLQEEVAQANADLAELKTVTIRIDKVLAQAAPTKRHLSDGWQEVLGRLEKSLDNEAFESALAITGGLLREKDHEVLGVANELSESGPSVSEELASLVRERQKLIESVDNAIKRAHDARMNSIRREV